MASIFKQTENVATASCRRSFIQKKRFILNNRPTAGRRSYFMGTFHYSDLADEMKAALPSAEKLQNELLTFEREHARG